MYIRNATQCLSDLGMTAEQEVVFKANFEKNRANLLKLGYKPEQITAYAAAKAGWEKTLESDLAQYRIFMTTVGNPATKENLAAAEDLYSRLRMYGRPERFGPTLMAAIEKSMKDFRTRVAAAAPTAVAIPSGLSAILKNWNAYIFRAPKYENYDFLYRLYTDALPEFARFVSAADMKKLANQLATFYNALPAGNKTVASVTGGVILSSGAPKAAGVSAAVSFVRETAEVNRLLDDYRAYLGSLPRTMDKYSAMLSIYNELKAKYAKHFTADALPTMAAKIADYYAKLTAPAAAPVAAAAAAASTTAPAAAAVTEAIMPATGYAYTPTAPATVQPMAVSEAPVEAAAAAAAAQAEEGITVMGMKIPFKFIYLGGAAVAFWMFSQQMTRGGRR